MVTDDRATTRLILRHEQARWAAMVGAAAAESAALARSQATARRAATVPDGEYLRAGPFRYEPVVERERLDRTDLIITRTDPGPYEDGRYLEFLARQAASVEMAISKSLGLDGEALEGILLGTSGAPRSNAVTSSRAGSRSASVVLSAGMVYLMYQASKASVTAWVPLDAPSGHLASFGSDLTAVAARLDVDPAPVELLVDLLASWFLFGQPRPASSKAPQTTAVLPLQLVTQYAERFIIGHEYGHALFDSIGVPAPPWLPAAPQTPFDREARADVFGALVVALSAANFDGVGPNVALQGAVMAMRIHEIADEAIAIATDTPMVSSATHPPFEERIRLVHLALQLLQKLSGDALPPDAVDPAPMEYATDTVSLIWERAKGPLIERIQGRRLHLIWTAGIG